jgi:hypothetical protein
MNWYCSIAVLAISVSLGNRQVIQASPCLFEQYCQKLILKSKQTWATDAISGLSHVSQGETPFAHPHLLRCPNRPKSPSCQGVKSSLYCDDHRREINTGRFLSATSAHTGRNA